MTKPKKRRTITDAQHAKRYSDARLSKELCFARYNEEDLDPVGWMWLQALLTEAIRRLALR